MNINLLKEVQKILDKFSKANFKIYIVGGAVRDLLMGKKVRDWDFTTDAKPEEILKLFPDGFYDNKFGTVGVPISGGRRPPNAAISRRAEGERIRGLRPQDASVREQESEDADQSVESQILEITTMRKEGDYTDHRHPVQVSWTNKLEEDLQRRDFTINAMALDQNLILIDPFKGKEDLENKLIKAVGNPEKRFKEDALRLIRAIRFASQLEFDIENDTFESIKKQAQLIKEIANERIRDELFKILSSVNPYVGLLRLREAGILQIILPEVEKCFGIVQEGPKHDRIYDIGDHSFRTMRETPSVDPLVKFAALLHDIGKAETVKKDQNGNVTFYNHEIEGAKLALNIAKRFNLSKKQTDKLYRLIRWHMFSTDERQTDSAIRRFIKNVELENLEDMFALRIGDRLGGDTRKPISWRMEEFQKRIKKVLEKPFSLADLKVNGNDVMKVLNIKPSRKVGEILDQLFNEVLEDSSKNTREYLLKRVKELMP